MPVVFCGQFACLFEGRQTCEFETLHTKPWLTSVPKNFRPLPLNSPQAVVCQESDVLINQYQKVSKVALKETQTFRVDNPSSVWRKTVFLSKPFLTLFDIYFYINPIRKHFQVSRISKEPFTVHYYQMYDP